MSSIRFWLNAVVCVSKEKTCTCFQPRHASVSYDFYLDITRFRFRQLDSRDVDTTYWSYIHHRTWLRESFAIIELLSEFGDGSIKRDTYRWDWVQDFLKDFDGNMFANLTETLCSETEDDPQIWRRQFVLLRLDSFIPRTKKGLIKASFSIKLIFWLLKVRILCFELRRYQDFF